MANPGGRRPGQTSRFRYRTTNQTLDEQPQKAWTPQELIDIAVKHPVNFAPGTQYEYSNTNIILLGMLIEQLTGMSASDAFQQRIFSPLGLHNSSLPAADDSSIPDPTTRPTPTRVGVDRGWGDLHGGRHEDLR
jgi:D-alanyl-D-alanine carboxypeptidase